ncbi:hypothetical protein [Paenibacillus sp.]|uniref:hypothetical protein n=1 Tax=Paenibacillus sp. TaxID=58172 RepID=UPI0028113BCE|nr:hypothetical protein [Paenibacillus sp.]
MSDEDEIVGLFQEDERVMSLLRAVKSLDLPDEDTGLCSGDIAGSEGAMLRSFFGHAAYAVVVSAVSFVFYWVLKIWIIMGRFTAADAPPGDISISEKAFYSYPVPVGYGIFMIGLSLWLCRFSTISSVRISAVFIFGMNAAIVLYFIVQFRGIAFG